MRSARWVLIAALGIAMFAAGLFAWLEGSVMLHPKSGTPYLATPDGPEKAKFYLYTCGLMGVGFATAAMAMWAHFSTGPVGMQLANELDKPPRSIKLPDGLFWGIFAGFVSLFIFIAFLGR